MGFFGNLIGHIKHNVSSAVGAAKSVGKALGHAASFAYDHKDIITSGMQVGGGLLMATGVGAGFGAGLLAAGTYLDKGGTILDVATGRESLGMGALKLGAGAALKYAKPSIQATSVGLKFASSLAKETGVL